MSSFTLGFTPANIILDSLKKRGLLANYTPALYEYKGQLNIYAGFDATASSLHVGHLLLLTVLSEFEKHGHKACLNKKTGELLNMIPQDLWAKVENMHKFGTFSFNLFEDMIKSSRFPEWRKDLRYTDDNFISPTMPIQSLIDHQIES